ncbi:unnamed protein product [Staurois parvus]|uniref:Secreted protein n=1 Tax=Staurois parvus TaxID=386267 RepID=A0ABN9F7J7_9NEOB|nr:unnamed protein product [Staurois parvus]
MVFCLTSLAVFPSVARGKVSAPQVVTPSYTQEYTAALLRDPFCTYLVLRSRDVPPAASPAISSGQCRHLSSGFRSLQRQDVRGRNWRET